MQTHLMKMKIKCIQFNPLLVEVWSRCWNVVVAHENNNTNQLPYFCSQFCTIAVVWSVLLLLWASKCAHDVRSLTYFHWIYTVWDYKWNIGVFMTTTSRERLLFLLAAVIICKWQFSSRLVDATCLFNIIKLKTERHIYFTNRYLPYDQ